MEKFGVQISLEAVRDARVAWNAARREFDRDVDKIMTRLLHEAARNMMSVHDVATASGLTPKRVRDLLRGLGLNPRDGKRLLADRAAKALHENSALLGIKPHEFDLMSPLAYLPMGGELRKQLLAEQASKVTEVEEVSGNPIHGINYWDDTVACEGLGIEDPYLVSDDLDKITCDGCRKILVRA